MKKVIIKEKFDWLSIVLTLAIALIVYYFALPALNLTSMGFWIYLVVILGVYAFARLTNKLDIKGNLVGSVTLFKVLFSLVVLIFLGIGLVNIFLSPIFNSKTYANRIEVDETGDFYKDVKQVDFSKVPLLDKASSRKLGDRVMGQMPELVSQFYVSNIYTQINYNDEIMRVTPLEYAGFFKYLSNKKTGITGYITVDSVDGSAELVKLDKGMKYMPSAMFNEDLDRRLRFDYPTKIFAEKYFEIDNEGNPYWIVPTIKYVGVGLREEIEGVIVLNPINGKSTFYEVGKIPSWIDHVYSSDLIIEQVDDWGYYKEGFLNSIFGQKNVTMTTTGYNYLVMNDDVYLYTGITSVASDESNLGFILSNLRTKETKFYSVPGAEEYSAMASAEGQVQQMNYTSTFPLLINLNGKATYLVSLKDNAGLVKMYGFIDVADYQKVTVSDASEGIEAAASKYLGGDSIDVEDSKLIQKDIIIRDLRTATISGNTYYYFVDTNNQKYMAPISINKELLPFISVGSQVNVSYKAEKEVIEINKIK